MPYGPRAQRFMNAARAIRANRAAAVASARAFPVVGTPYRVGAFYKTRNRKFRRAVERAINSNKETMFLDYAFGKSELFHNNWTVGTGLFQLNDAAKMPSQGDSDSQRTGNVIHLRGMRLRVMFLFKGDRLNSKVRFLVLSFPKGTLVSSVNAFMDNVTGNQHIDPIDKGRCRVHIDKTVGNRNINPGVPTTAKEVTIFRNYYIKMKSRVTFYDDGAQENNQLRDYFAITIAYDTYGSLTTDNVAAVQIWRRLSWKDV